MQLYSSAQCFVPARAPMSRSFTGALEGCSSSCMSVRFSLHHLVEVPVSWVQRTHPASRARPCALCRKWGCLLPELKPTPRFPWNCEKEKPCCAFCIFLTVTESPCSQIFLHHPHRSQDRARMLPNSPHVGHKVAGCLIFLSFGKSSLYFLNPRVRRFTPNSCEGRNASPNSKLFVLVSKVEALLGEKRFFCFFPVASCERFREQLEKCGAMIPPELPQELEGEPRVPVSARTDCTASGS